MGIQAVLLDLDGTLADTAPDLGIALNRLLEEEGRATLDYEEIRKHASFGAKGLVERGFNDVADGGDGELERLTGRFFDLYAESLCEHTRLFPGVEKTLRELEGRGIAWGVVTNKAERFAEPILRQLDLLEGAACRVYGDTTVRKKPAPDALLYAAEALALAPARCLYVGDSERDVAAAKAAGMKVLVVTYGYESREGDIGSWGCDGAVDVLTDVLGWMDGTDQK